MSEALHETREEQVNPAGSAPKTEPQTEHLEPREGRGALRVAPVRGQAPSGLHRTASAVRTVVPLLQKLLPLLDGNVASAVANLLAPRLMSGPVVDLSPLDTSLMKLRGDLAVIQDRNAQQDVAFKRIDDQLETMKEAVERTAVEQREVAEEVARVRKNLRVFALAGILLLVASIGLNAALFLYMKGSFH